MNEKKIKPILAVSKLFRFFLMIIIPLVTIIFSFYYYVNSGDIVVALIDQNEVTLKRFRSFKNSIALEPANKNFKIRIFGEDRVKIQGKLVGLIRKF